MRELTCDLPASAIDRAVAGSCRCRTQDCTYRQGPSSSRRIMPNCKIFTPISREKRAPAGNSGCPEYLNLSPDAPPLLRRLLIPLRLFVLLLFFFRLSPAGLLFLAGRCFLRGVRWGCCARSEALCRGAGSSVGFTIVRLRTDASFLADLFRSSAPVDCSAGPSADGWVPAGYSVSRGRSFGSGGLVPDGAAPADCRLGSDDWAQLDRFGYFGAGCSGRAALFSGCAIGRIAGG